MKKNSNKTNPSQTFVKVPIGKTQYHWLSVIMQDKHPLPKLFENGQHAGISLKNKKQYLFHCADVIAFYEGKLSDIVGLGMAYIPTADVCNVLDTVVPDSMGYEIHIACRVVQETIGKSLTEFVAEKLHYTELELCKSLSAEQVDAVALAIYNIEYKRQGMIIGDQTGIGKGRVAAAMIRYGYFQKLKPIFLSEKPNLFTDIYRDLVDIGSNKLVPFIVNGKEAKTDIKDADGNVVYQAIAKTDQDKVFKNQILPKEYDFICSTYSQFNSPKEKPLKPNFLRAMAADNLIVMDESHNASGSSNTGAFLQEVLGLSKGVVFLSATFAKRPDNMPVYAMKTCISEANMSHEQLVEGIKEGGVALQEIISAQLVSEGQMIRRERSFEGVEVNYIVLEEKEKEHKAVFDNITECLRGIIKFQENFIKPLIEELDDVASASGEQTETREGTDKAGVDSTPYFSKVFQVVNQMLFSIKAKSVAELAIQRLEEGKKPIIAFSSTMETFLDELSPEDGNNTIPLDFSKVLEKGLDGVMRYTVTLSNGKKEYKFFLPSELKPEAQDAYYELLNKIKSISSGISISPIDVIKHTIRSAGFSCDEVTGRKLEVQPIKGRENYGVLMNRKKILANDAFRMFNNNELDCLLINQSGSTGASAHAIPTKKVTTEQVKQRVMLVLQPELDINREVQKRGRINRTGQILKPIYDYVTSCIPAEKRLMMMLRKKLKSLDANTTSSQKTSNNILNVDDFLNKYGDKLVTEYLLENPELNLLLDDPLDLTKEEKTHILEGAAAKVSGRVAVLATEQQEKFYSDIIEAYNDYVTYLKQCDQYDLEIEVLNLEAETTSEKVVIEGKQGESVFSQDTILEHCTVNVLKKPFSRTELENLLQKNLEGRDGKELQQEALDEATEVYKKKLGLDVEKINQKYEKVKAGITSEKDYKKIPPEHSALQKQYISNREQEIENARLESIEIESKKSENKLYNISNFLQFFYGGKVCNYPSFADTYHKAICLGYHIDKKKENPYNPGAIKIKLAIASSDKYIDLPLSGETGKKLLEVMGASTMISKDEQNNFFDNWDYYTKNSNVSRKKAFIVTGNILQGYSKYSGKLISYTTKDGSTKKGILLPENYDPESTGKSGFVSVPIVRAKDYILQMGEDEILMTVNDAIIISHYGYNNKDYSLTTKATKVAQDFFKDAKIISLCNNTRDGFEKRGDKMIAYFTKANMAKLIDYLQEKFNLAVSITEVAYQEFFEKKQVINKKSNLIAKAEARYQQDKANFDNRKAMQNGYEKPQIAADAKAKLKLKMKLKAKALELLNI